MPRIPKWEQEYWKHKLKPLGKEGKRWCVTSVNSEWGKEWEVFSDFDKAVKEYLRNKELNKTTGSRTWLMKCSSKRELGRGEKLKPGYGGGL